MIITYGIWQGSRLLSIDNKATSAKDIDTVINELNSSDLGKDRKFLAHIQKIEVK